MSHNAGERLTSWICTNSEVALGFSLGSIFTNYEISSCFMVLNRGICKFLCSKMQFDLIYNYYMILNRHTWFGPAHTQCCFFYDINVINIHH